MYRLREEPRSSSDVVDRESGLVVGMVAQDGTDRKEARCS